MKRLTIGLIIDRPESGPYQQDLLEGVHRQAQAKGHNLLVLPASVLMSPSRRFPDWSLGLSTDRPLDAVIVAAASLAAWGGPATVLERMGSLKNLPLVSIGEALKGVPSILLDNRTGLSTLLDHMLGHHGCKAPVFLSGPLSAFDASERLSVFQEALLRHNIANAPQRIFQGDFLFSGGVEAVQYFWNGPQDKPDLVVCANDNMAFGVLHELQARGIRVPEDVAVTGFDDVAFCGWLASPLSTVRQPLADMGALAVSMALGELTSTQIMVPTVSVLRRTCGCAVTDASEPNAHQRHQLALYSEAEATMGLEASFTRFATECQASGHLSAAVERERELIGALGMPWWYFCHTAAEEDVEPVPSHLHLVWASGRATDLPVATPSGTLQGFPDFLDLDGRWTAVQIDVTFGHRDSQQLGALIVQYSTTLLQRYEWLRVRLSDAAASIRTTQRLKLLNDALQDASRKLEELSITDELTGAYNRRGFLTMGIRELAACRRQQVGLCVYYLDLDGLKQINDCWGHEAGDLAISAFAKVLTASMRSTDLMARLGGDEFTLLASHALPTARELLVQRLDQHIATFNRSRSDWKLAYSLGGVYSPPADESTLADLMKRADTALYQQKQLKKSSH